MATETEGGLHPDVLNLDEEEEGARADLEKEVRARDAEVSALEKTRLEKHQELAGLQKELEEERLRQMKESILHRIEVERLKRQTKAVEERLEALERDMQDTYDTSIELEECMKREPDPTLKYRQVEQ